MRKKFTKATACLLASILGFSGSSLPVYASEFTDGTEIQAAEDTEQMQQVDEEFLDGLEEAPLFEDSARQQENLQKSNEPEASIGENKYDTLKKAWDAAQNMTEYNGGAVSEANPVVIKVLKDCEVTQTLKQIKGHIKLTSGDGVACIIKRGSSFKDQLIYMGMGNVSTFPPVYDEERSLYLENIVIDGNQEVQGKYPLIYMHGIDSSEHLTLGQGAVLQNNNITYQGGALYVGGKYKKEGPVSKVTILEGAEIKNNTTTKDGGAINISTEASIVEMKGGAIQNNSTTGKYNYGGGIRVWDGQFLMSGGSVTGNKTAYGSGGGGIYTGASGTVKLTGGTISGNKSNNNPRDIDISSKGKLTLGGDIQIGDKGTIHMGKDSKIMLTSPVTHTFDLDFTLGVTEGQLVVEKGEEYSGDLDPAKFTLAGSSYILVKSPDGNGLVTQSATYKVNAYATTDGSDNITEFARDETYETGTVYEKTWNLDGDYADAYAFYPYSEEKWSITPEDKSGATVTVSSEDDYDSVHVKVEGCRKYITIMPYVQKKSDAPSIEEAELQVDYAADTITYNGDVYEVYREKKKTAEGVIKEGDISSLIPTSAETTTTIYLRKKRTEKEIQSRWTPVTIYAHADFTAVDKALERARSLNKGSYTSESWKKLEAAMAEVDRNKNASQQKDVDMMAEKINEAIDNLGFIYIPTPKPLPENVPDGSRWDGENIVTPDGTVIKPDGTIVLPDGTVLTWQEGKAPSIDKEGTVTAANGIKIDRNGNITVPGLDKESAEDDVTITVGEDGERPKLNPEAGIVTTPEGGRVILPDGQGGRKELEVSAGTTVTADGLITLPDGTVINQKGEIHKTDGSIWDLYGNVVRPETPVVEIAETPGGNNKVKAVLLKECAGATGYDFVISENPNCIVDKDYYRIDKNRLETEGEFTYIQEGSYYVYCHAWTKNSQGKKVFSKWSNGKEVEVTARTPEQPRIRKVSVKKNKVTVTYTKTADTEGYDLVLGTALKKVNGELRPVDYGKAVKKIKNKNTVTVVFDKVPKGTYYAGLHAYNRTSKDGKKVFSPWSASKKIQVK